LFWHFRFKKKYLFTNILITFIVLVFAFLLTIEDFSITTPEPLNETTVEKIYLYENKTFSLTNSFMDYDLDWIKEIDSDYSRVRVNDSNSLNSFIFTYNQKAKFEIPLKDGCYNIITYHGDSEFPQGPHYLEIENNIFNEYTQKDEIINFTTTVCIKNNLLHLTLGNNSNNYAMLNALAIKKNDTNKWYYINFGDKQNNDPEKFRFLINGLEENLVVCSPTFLQKSKCQGKAVMKEFQTSNCQVTWALYQPCSLICENGKCVVK